ncbi:FUSC family membrane protein [Pedobacter sp. P351]|uniref:FUSC family protein n=1 Tax=Pedobacter superstes TaxID=3133441 RepID=UPI0030AB5D9D
MQKIDKNQTKEIRKFLFSQYFSDGLRITFGVLLPSLIFAQMGNLEAGITISLGAITTSIPDNPGPVIHKRNAMLACIAFMLIVAFITGFINQYALLVTIEIFLLCFFFSMLNIYGNRASSISTAVLIIMILTIDRSFNIYSLLEYVGFLAAGGIWYMTLSLMVSQIRPYRIAQHTLGECAIRVGEYLRLKAEFYNLNQDTDENYKKLIDQQIIVHQQQDTVREVLFKDKMITKNQTNTARLLILIFSDLNDLFEHSMATHYDYQTIRSVYGSSGVLKGFYSIIHNLGNELENLGIDINANERPRPLYDFQPQLEQLKASIDKVDNNLVLKKILVNMRNIINRIQNIYSYFKDKKLDAVAMNSEKDLGRFISHQSLDIKLFIENLTFSSSIFRHSIRVAIVCIIGYLISKISTGAHSYWILLTILVILKPAFSLTKQRNYERLIGTFVGGLAGALIIHFVKDEAARFAFLLLFMIGAYSFQRLNYVVSVLFMTPFILIMFSFIGMGDLSLVRERIIDTFIGSFIALIASYFIFPSWEYPQLKNHMHKLLLANYNYLQDVAEGLTGKGFNITEYKLIRKELYLSSANMASALQRMLSEPKNKQKNVREVNKFIVLNHMLSSYIATLVATIRHEENRQVNPLHIRIIRKALYQLYEAISILNEGVEETEAAEIRVSEPFIKIIEDNIDSKLIAEQLEFINKVSGDLLRICEKIGKADTDTALIDV